MHLFHLQLQLINHFRDQQWQTPPYFFMVLEGAETTLELAMMEVLWHRRFQGPHLITGDNKLMLVIRSILLFASDVGKCGIPYLRQGNPIRARPNVCIEFRQTFATEIERASDNHLNYATTTDGPNYKTLPKTIFEDKLISSKSYVYLDYFMARHLMPIFKH